MDDANRSRKNYINKRSIAKNFILTSATEDDLEKLTEYISQRRKMLQYCQLWQFFKRVDTFCCLVCTLIYLNVL